MFEKHFNKIKFFNLKKKTLDYLKLKRITGKQAQQKKNDKDKNDGFISRYAGGLCFDVWERDKSM